MCFVLHLLENALFMYKSQCTPDAPDQRKEYVLNMTLSEFNKEFLQFYIYDVHREDLWPKDVELELHQR